MANKLATAAAGTALFIAGAIAGNARYALAGGKPVAFDPPPGVERVTVTLTYDDCAGAPHVAQADGGVTTPGCLVGPVVTTSACGQAQGGKAPDDCGSNTLHVAAAAPDAAQIVRSMNLGLASWKKAHGY